MLTVLRLVLTFVTFVLTELRRLLTAKTAPVLGIAVKSEASPAKRPYIVPAEIVEKKPKLVDVVIAE